MKYNPWTDFPETLHEDGEPFEDKTFILTEYGHYKTINEYIVFISNNHLIQGTKS